MKVRVTRKEVLNNYTNVIHVGYCDLQFMLKYRDANFYTAGIYGWNADIYEIDHTTAIVTGYRPFGNIVPSYDCIKAFDNKALAIQSERIAYEDMRARVASLLEEFLTQVTIHRADNEGNE